MSFTAGDSSANTDTRFPMMTRVPGVSDHFRHAHCRHAPENIIGKLAKLSRLRFPTGFMRLCSRFAQTDADS